MDQSQSAGDSDYQQAKQRLLQELFGPPQRAKERPKPHKAIDGKAFETLAEMREYEEANFPVSAIVQSTPQTWTIIEHDGPIQLGSIAVVVPAVLPARRLQEALQARLRAEDPRPL